MLNWSRQDLADASKVSDRTITDFERGARQPYTRTLRDIKEAFETAGIEFIDSNGSGVGVRLR